MPSLAALRAIAELSYTLLISAAQYIKHKCFFHPIPQFDKVGSSLTYKSFNTELMVAHLIMSLSF